MDGQNPVMISEEKKRKSWLMWAVLVVIVILAAIFIFWQGPAALAPAPEIGVEDTTSAIDAQIESIDLGNLESELQDINAELDQL
ncbi:MAG: hypothetical protein V1885_01210 [Candidatus Brennerbacteria bacterium]